MVSVVRFESDLIALIQKGKIETVRQTLKKCSTRIRRVVLPNVIYHAAHHAPPREVLQLIRINVRPYGPIPILSSPIERDGNLDLSYYQWHELYIQAVLLCRSNLVPSSPIPSPPCPYEPVSFGTWIKRFHRKKRKMTPYYPSRKRKQKLLKRV